MDSSNGSGPHLSVALVADPDERVRRELAVLLERLGCNVLQAESGDEVLADAQRVPPALVVLDVGLSGSSAYEVCRELREAFGQGLPIVFISEHRLEPADEVAGLLLGADDYLAKPIRSDVFLARARRLLARSGRRGRAGAALTPREREVLALLVEGVMPPEIARTLCITAKTTATHIEHILGKLGAHSQAQAVAFAVHDRIVDATV
jgi:DNA-binding NarL/FixJ family response regulator